MYPTPKVPKEIRNFIRQMCLENPTWGAPIIHSELQLLGYDMAEATVASYMVKQEKPASQTWKTFLRNHVKDIAAIDFFTVPTATFRILYCFIVICHHRRKIVHFNVIANPTAQWTAQQLRKENSNEEQKEKSTEAKASPAIQSNSVGQAAVLS